MDVLLKEINGKETIWYSENYLKTQLDLAFRSGISSGIKVNFHAVEPCDRKQVDEMISLFKEKVEECYKNEIISSWEEYVQEEHGILPSETIIKDRLDTVYQIKQYHDRVWASAYEALVISSNFIKEGHLEEVFPRQIISFKKKC